MLQMPMVCTHRVHRCTVKLCTQGAPLTLSYGYALISNTVMSDDVDEIINMFFFDLE